IVPGGQLGRGRAGRSRSRDASSLDRSRLGQRSSATPPSPRRPAPRLTETVLALRGSEGIAHFLCTLVLHLLLHSCRQPCEEGLKEELMCFSQLSRPFSSAQRRTTNHLIT